VQDAIIALQNSDNNKALVHLKLADQQLAALPNGGNSSSIQPTRILLADAVQALVQNSDNNKALVHLKLADQQLSTATSENTVSPNAASESSKVLMAMAPSKNTGAVAIAPSTTSIYNLILEGKTYPIKYQTTGLLKIIPSVSTYVYVHLSSFPFRVLHDIRIYYHIKKC
jgi:hypothetical protein